MIKLICKTCDDPFEVFPYRSKAKYCSFQCYWESLKGRKLSEATCEKLSKAKMGHISWNKGKKCPQISKALIGRKLSPEHIKKSAEGRTKPDGHERMINKYIYVVNRNHPFCNKLGYVKRANLVMEEHIGRFLTPEERVHHNNEIKIDDRPENLRLFLNESAHQKFHSIKNPLCAKGQHNSPKTEFKKGHKLMPGSEKGWFKKGMIPWNKKY